MRRSLCLLVLLLGACGDDTPPFDPEKALLDPSLATLTAPDRFRVKFETTKGDIVVEVIRAWAPHGADRLYNLARTDFFTDMAFFRVIRTPRLFMAQFGVSGDPAVNQAWQTAFIPADPPLESNRRGTLTFGQTQLGPHTRNVQLFINYTDNIFLDRDFAPVGRVIDGMDVANSLYAGYGESAPQGRGPVQGRLMFEGNVYLRKEFPELDYIRRATLVE